jgi:hypothetical protein
MAASEATKEKWSEAEVSGRRVEYPGRSALRLVSDLREPRGQFQGRKRKNYGKERQQVRNFELPARVRCDRAARELREGVIGVLKEIHRHGGDAAFHRAARDLVASVAAIVAQVEGRQRMLDVLGLIDRATEA